MLAFPRGIKNIFGTFFFCWHLRLLSLKCFHLSRCLLQGHSNDHISYVQKTFNSTHGWSKKVCHKLSDYHDNFKNVTFYIKCSNNFLKVNEIQNSCLLRAHCENMENILCFIFHNFTRIHKLSHFLTAFWYFDIDSHISRNNTSVN